MDPFTVLTATAVPLMRDNVDTDAIIPSREMRTVSGRGLGQGLFAGWRYREIGSRTTNPDFILNNPAHAGARILLSGDNFGCGSSREHAVWALVDYGFRSIIASSFNPIFYGNCIANGVLPITLDAGKVQEIASLVLDEPATELTVDLVNQEVRADRLRPLAFEISSEAKEALIGGLDPIAQTLQLREKIEAFRKQDAALRPWIYEPVHRSTSS